MAQILSFKKQEKPKPKIELSPETMRLWHMDIDIATNISTAIRDGGNPVVIAGLLANRITTILECVENKEDKYKIVNEICKLIFTKTIK